MCKKLKLQGVLEYTNSEALNKFYHSPPQKDKSSFLLTGYLSAAGLESLKGDFYRNKPRIGANRKAAISANTEGRICGSL